MSRSKTTVLTVEEVAGLERLARLEREEEARHAGKGAFVDLPHDVRWTVRRSVESLSRKVSADYSGGGIGFNVIVEFARFTEDFPSGEEIAAALATVGFRLAVVDCHGNRCFHRRGEFGAWERIYRAEPVDALGLAAIDVGSFVFD